MLTQIAEIFKLDPKEKFILEKLYELGEQPASVIARHTGIQRNSTRFILDNLVEIGLVCKSLKANTQIYMIESKANIIKSLELKKKNIEAEYSKKIAKIKEYGDQLDNRFAPKNMPKVKFYEGEAGIEKVYEDTLNSEETIVSWASFDAMHGTLPEYFKTYYKRRSEKGIHIKSIHPDTKLAKERIKKDNMESRTSMLVDHSKYNWTPEIQVYNDKINIVSFKEKFGVIIESKEIAEALKTIFRLNWSNLR